MEEIQRELRKLAKKRNIKDTIFMSCEELVKLLDLEEVKARYYDNCTMEEFDNCIYLYLLYSYRKFCDELDEYEEETYN